MVLLGLVIFSFGFSFSDLLLRIYGGPHLAVDGGTSLLRAQCLLILFLAVNGVTECFARSVMTEQEINKFNKKLVFLSCVYLILTWAVTSVMGAVGLVIANCVNMVIRIYFSVQIIEQTFLTMDPSPLQGRFNMKIIFFSRASNLKPKASKLKVWRFRSLLCLKGSNILTIFIKYRTHKLSNIVDLRTS